MMGPQACRLTGAVRRWATLAPVVKAIDNLEILRAAPPGARLIWRHYLGPAYAWLEHPDRLAAELIDSLQGFRAPGRLYLETLNEVGKADRERYLRCLAHVVPTLHAAGLQVIGPSWGSGDYEAEDWAAFRAADWCGLDGIALHAYWAERGPTEWNGWRWHQFYDAREDRGLPVFITECGRDRVRDGLDGGYLGTPGWRRAGITARAYAGELAAYARGLATHEYATPFCSGPTPDWADFDVDPVSDDLMELLGHAPWQSQDGEILSDYLTEEVERVASEVKHEDLAERVARNEAQIALLTAALKAFRQGKFTGADGVDGLIVALQGGAPLGFEPSYPKKA